MDRLKTGFGTLMLFLSVQAAGFLSPAQAATTAPQPTDASGQASDDLAGAAKSLVETLERAADDAFAFRFFDAPAAPNTGADVPLGAAPLSLGPIESVQQNVSFDLGVADHVDLAALVKSAVETAHHDWMF